MSYTKFVYASDVHGDEQDPVANAALFKFLKLWKPQIRVMGGDLWDFRSLRKKASEEERRETILTDTDAGLNWVDQFEPTHFLRGNHDERLWELALENNGPASDHAKTTIARIEQHFKKLKCPIYPYDIWDGFVQFGSLKMIHGFRTGETAAIKEARANDSVLFGHIHTFQTAILPNRSRRAGWASGCLCNLKLKYLSRQHQALAHMHGWLYGIIRSDGTFEVFQAKGLDGKFIITNSVKEI